MAFDITKLTQYTPGEVSTDQAHRNYYYMAPEEEALVQGILMRQPMCWILVLESLAGVSVSMSSPPQPIPIRWDSYHLG